MTDRRICMFALQLHITYHLQLSLRKCNNHCEKVLAQMALYIARIKIMIYNRDTPNEKKYRFSYEYKYRKYSNNQFSIQYTVYGNI